MTIDKKFCDFVFCDLPGYNKLFAILISSGSHVFLFASELNCDTGLFNSSKSFFINELSKTSFKPEHFFAGTTKEELNGIKNVTFTWTVKASDGIELGIEAIDDCSVHVSFEAFKNDLFDVHGRRLWVKMFG